LNANITVNETESRLFLSVFVIYGGNLFGIVVLEHLRRYTVIHVISARIGHFAIVFKIPAYSYVEVQFRAEDAQVFIMKACFRINNPNCAK